MMPKPQDVNLELAVEIMKVVPIKEQMNWTIDDFLSHENLEDYNRTNVQQSRSLYEKMSEQVTITYEEQKELRSIVSKLAISLTEEHQKRQGKTYSGNLFKAWKGMFMSRIHSKLKKRMNVVRYTSIKRVDYDEALTYLNVLTYEHFSLIDLQPTPAVLNVLELEEK